MPKRKAASSTSRAAALTLMATATLWLSPSQFDHHHKPMEKNTQQYDYMVEQLAITDDYDELANESTKNNPVLFEALKAFTRSCTYVESDAPKRQKRDSAFQFVFSLIIDLLIRVLNGKLWCYTIMLLTLAAARHNVNTTFWRMLVKCKLLYSKKIGVEVAQDLGRKMLTTHPSWSSKVVGIAVFDNCAYKVRTNFEHVREERQNLFYQTINWFHTPATNKFDDELQAKGEGWVRCR